jgi:hypothetical protein
MCILKMVTYATGWVRIAGRQAELGWVRGGGGRRPGSRGEAERFSWKIFQDDEALAEEQARFVPGYDGARDARQNRVLLKNKVLMDMRTIYPNCLRGNLKS